jgi:hypothetical protein
VQIYTICWNIDEFRFVPVSIVSYTSIKLVQ